MKYILFSLILFSTLKVVGQTKDCKHDYVLDMEYFQGCHDCTEIQKCKKCGKLTNWNPWTNKYFDLTREQLTKSTTIIIDSTNINRVKAGSGALITYDQGDITIKNDPPKKKRDYFASRLVEIYDQYSKECKKDSVLVERYLPGKLYTYEELEYKKPDFEGFIEYLRKK